MPLVVLSPSGGGGLPEGSPEHRYEVTLTLDHQGFPDPNAWREDAAMWPARRFWPGQGLMDGDVLYDPDMGWALRFFRRDDNPVDAPLQAVIRGRAPCRPGETVTISEPDGSEYAWRIVGVG
ncbi:hypothetical protein J8J14_06450 [Roseomonas sp. SSH11]|uniref:Uncharacterized protein n=1 Tax=Pararoseomonas baculiformis TaxID=2820812 RepID=A0ABS4AC25_9PROT|nr:hypothetical protein [Pararoseomonas baculiformis]MBP0444416.1 hypothetical protein [Pararoseomonas baculiformis]